MDLTVLDIPLRILRLPGLHPDQVSWTSKITSFITLLTAIISLITSVMEICRTELTIVSVVPVIETIMVTMEVA